MKEPEHSCPFLDKVLEIEDNIMKSLKYNSNYDEDDLKACIEDAVWYDGDIAKPIEKARSIHQELRDWGNHYKDECESMQNYINELESKLKEVEK